MDITNFMTWFLSEIVDMFTKIFNILDGITFFGTSLLRVIVVITILVPLLSVVLTISNSTSVIGSRYEKVKKSKERSSKDNEE